MKIVVINYRDHLTVLSEHVQKYKSMKHIQKPKFIPEVKHKKMAPNIIPEYNLIG